MILEEKEMGNISFMGWINQCNLDTYLQPMSQTKLMASDEQLKNLSMPIFSKATSVFCSMIDIVKGSAISMITHIFLNNFLLNKGTDGVRLGVIQTNHAFKELQSHSVCIEQGDLGQVLEHLGQVLEATCHSSMKGNNT
jgi:hypothetical protein